MAKKVKYREVSDTRTGHLHGRDIHAGSFKGHGDAGAKLAQSVNVNQRARKWAFLDPSFHVYSLVLEAMIRKEHRIHCSLNRNC